VAAAPVTVEPGSALRRSLDTGIARNVDQAARGH
jgi:hypothetical protein